jgi:hypothetical protein
MSAFYRKQAVVDSTTAKLFGGKYAGRVERHLSEDDIRALVDTIYDIAFVDGQKIIKPDRCSRCQTVTTELKVARFVPGLIVPPGQEPKMPTVRWVCSKCMDEIKGGAEG